MDWPNFFRGVFYSLLPRTWWGEWLPSSTVDFERSALLSGLLEFGIFLFLLVTGYFRFLVLRAHQLQAASGANEGTQLYFLVILSFEYSIHPLSLFAIFLAVEGAFRSWAAFFANEVVPSFPFRLAARVSTWRKKRMTNASLAPEIADHFERQEEELHIFAQRPKDGWRAAITVAVEGEFYEIARIETAQSVRPIKHVLRKLPAGGVMRGGYRYDPPGTN